MATTWSSTSPRTRTSPAPSPSRTSTSARARCSPSTSSRRCGRRSARRILYASGSGVYGDLGELEAGEDHGPLAPISTYGASKLAGEALISSYAYMFGLSGLRLPLRQRRRAAPDPRRRLRLRAPAAARTRRGCASSATARRASPTSTSTTSCEAVLLADARSAKPFDVFNVATGDYITVPGDRRARLRVPGSRAGRDRRLRVHRAANSGWKGDVPVVRLDRPSGSASSAGRCRRSTRARRCGALMAMLPDPGRACASAERAVAPAVRPSSSTATACSTGRSCEADGLTRPHDRGVVRGAAGRGGGLCHAARGRASSWSWSPTSRTSRAAPGRRRGRGGASTRRSPSGCRSTRSASARTTTRTVRVPQAARRACSGGGDRARHRPARSVMVGDRWRDIEAGRARRVPDRLRRSRATTSARPERPDPRRGPRRGVPTGSLATAFRARIRA